MPIRTVDEQIAFSDYLARRTKAAHRADLFFGIVGATLALAFFALVLYHLAR